MMRTLVLRNPVDAVCLILAGGRIPEEVIDKDSFKKATDYYNEIVNDAPRCVYKSSVQIELEDRRTMLERLEAVLTVCDGALFFRDGRVFFSVNPAEDMKVYGND